jgi:hypothetical protein
VKPPHDLKCHPEPFNALVVGDKTFEFRKDDRGFELHDLLRVREWHGEYTGRCMLLNVTYLLRGPAFGIPEGFIVMSVSPTIPSSRMFPPP